MNILRKVTWKSMWKNKTRTIVTIIGIILSAAMFTAVTTLGYSLWSYLLKTEIYYSGDYFLQVDYTSQEYLDTLSQDDRVSKIGSLGVLGYTTIQVEWEDGYIGQETCVVAAGDQNFYDMVTIHLEEGRLPQTKDEIVITRNFYDYLLAGGRPGEVGDTITLEVVPEYSEYDDSIPLPSKGNPFTKTYTIVGISETFTRLDDETLALSHLFTFADSGDTPIWYRTYLKTAVPMDANTISQEIPEGTAATRNDRLLEFYGVTKYRNYNTMITSICGVLAAIIMVGSVSLIYNAFSISVSERTKQFGLLSSVGATRKQIRGAVFSEAMLLSMIGIPLGLLSGYVGIAVTLHILSPRIHTLLGTGDGTIKLDPICSPIALAVAAVIALLTVLISSTIPARRAAKISPIDAIRQKDDYHVPKKNIRVSKPIYRLFGLPGVLSRKYYKVSKKKYRTTVVSLVISIVLFISAASASQMIRATVDRTINTENYDMRCFGTRETLDKIRQQDFVENAVYSTDGYDTRYDFVVSVPNEMLSDSFLECWDAIHEEYDSLDKNMHTIRLVYLEDAVFRQYLAEHGLPEEPYFSADIPSALVVAKEITVYRASSQGGEVDRYTYAYEPYDGEGKVLPLLQNGVPDDLDPFAAEKPGMQNYEYYTSEDGDPILAITPIVEVGDGMVGEDWEHRAEYLMRLETAGNGVTTVGYYRRDTVTGAVSQVPEAVKEMDTPKVKIGATIRELPFGISGATVNWRDCNYLILPMSAAPEELHGDFTLCIKVSDYSAAKAYMERNLERYNWFDCKEGEENNRTLILLINVFSYGFIILISLISVANVFNTISTNVALRRRDFGMLRSTGFRKKDLLRMMNYECLTYGVKALLWGFPISLVISYLIFKIEIRSASIPFAPPWSALLIAALCVFLVVFTTMFYAMSKLRKDNPIDAIRMENT